MGAPPIQIPAETAANSKEGMVIKMKKNKVFPLIYMIIITIITYLPIAVVAAYSFNESKLSSVWAGFSLKWYKELFNDSSMREALINSLVLGLISSVAAAVIATAAVLSKKKYDARASRKGKALASFMTGASMLPIMIPEIILGMVYLAFFHLLRFPFGLLTLVIAHTAFSIPYIYMQVSSRAASMDTSVPDAARDLGAAPVRAFFDVILPYLAPSILSGMFLSFAMSFDDVIISIFVTGVNVNTLPIKVYTQIKTGVTPKINALCTIMISVTLICTVLWAITGKRSKKTPVKLTPEERRENGKIT